MGYRPIPSPDYYKNPQVLPSIESLLGISDDLLSGTSNDYYSPIGEFGSDEFDAMLDDVSKRIINTANETVARKGVGRSGEATSVSTKAIADVTSEAEFNDYIRTLAARERERNAGISTLSTAGSMALNEQNAQNQFNLTTYQVEESAKQFAYQMRKQEQAQKNAFLSSLISGGIGAIGNFITGGMSGSFSTGSDLMSASHFANTFAPKY